MIRISRRGVLGQPDIYLRDWSIKNELRNRALVYDFDTTLDDDSYVSLMLISIIHPLKYPLLLSLSHQLLYFIQNSVVFPCTSNCNLTNFEYYFLIFLPIIIFLLACLILAYRKYNSPEITLQLQPIQ